jgi:hypothetical protein
MIELNNFKNDFIVEYIHQINFNNNVDVNNKLDYYKKNIDSINIDYQQNSLELLKIEDELIFYLHKYCLKTHDINNTFIIKMLNLILNISTVLKKRVNLPDFNINDKNKNELKRCSYKFCKFKENCNYNYCKKKCICYQDHYVHHMVNFDINQIINYITQNLQSTNHLEILKSIKTLAFVINHMKNELSIRCLYCKPNEIERNHIVNADNIKKIDR